MDQNSLYKYGFLGKGKEVKEYLKILKGQLIQSKISTLVELRQLQLAIATKIGGIRDEIWIFLGISCF